MTYYFLEIILPQKRKLSGASPGSWPDSSLSIRMTSLRRHSFRSQQNVYECPSLKLKIAKNVHVKVNCILILFSQTSEVHKECKDSKITP
jgi:hypothetical protein